MTDRTPLLRSLDPHHQRVGYLGVLVCVALRGLDLADALRTRIEEVLFERIYADDPRRDVLNSRLTPDSKRLLARLREPDDDPAAILRSEPVGDSWDFLSALWLSDEAMPSHLGYLNRSKVTRLIDLGRWLGILLPTLELTETGYLLRVLIEETRGRCEREEGDGTFNWINPAVRPAVTALYLKIYLAAEGLWPFLLNELVKRNDGDGRLTTRGDEGLLRCSVNEMIEATGKAADLDDVLAMRNLTAFREAIEGKPSTAENYLRPRLEILVDLGLLGRRKSKEAKKSGFSWVVTDRTRRLASELECLLSPEPAIDRLLNTSFYRIANLIFDRTSCEPKGDNEVLLWFTRAYKMVSREIGFTPGTLVSELACLLAYEDHVHLEKARVMETVVLAAKGQWGSYLKFSGGSRFDDEFLINVDPQLEPQLKRIL